MISVSIVDDEKELRHSITTFVNGSPGFHCVSAYNSAEAALKDLPNDKPDVVLMDINLGGMNGIECVERLKAAVPTMQVLMLTVYEDTDQIFKALAAGASGYLLKRSSPTKLLSAIREVHGGGSPMSSSIARKVVASFQKSGQTGGKQTHLSPREEAVLNCLAKGLTSGYLPLGATMMSDEIAETVIRGGYFAHGFTYSGHPSCAAAALANLHVIEELGLIARTRDETGPYFQGKLQEMAEHPAVAEARGHGLIGALELVPREGREGLTPTSMLGMKAWTLIRKEGAMVRGIRDLIALAPPLIITREEVDKLFISIRRGLDRVWD